MENPYEIDYSIIKDSPPKKEKRKIDPSFCLLFEQNIKISNPPKYKRKKQRISEQSNKRKLENFLCS